MYFWKLEITLKSGKTIIGYDKNNFDNSRKLAEKFLQGGDNYFISLGNLDNTENIFVRIEDISVMTISVGGEEKK